MSSAKKSGEAAETATKSGAAAAAGRGGDGAGEAAKKKEHVPLVPPKDPQEAAERDAFVKACIAALREREDLAEVGLSGEAKEAAAKKAAKKAAAPPKKRLPEAAGVLRAFCFDFPDASADDCESLALALRSEAFRLNHRVSGRAVRGIESLARDKKSGASAAGVALALSVHCVRKVLEMDRRAVVRFAAKVDVAEDVRPKARRPPKKKEDDAVEKAASKIKGTFQGRKRVIQRRFNVGILEAISERKASTL